MVVLYRISDNSSEQQSNLNNFENVNNGCLASTSTLAKVIQGENNLYLSRKTLSNYSLAIFCHFK